MIYEKIYFWIILITVSVVMFFIKQENKRFLMYKVFPSLLHFIVATTGAIIVGVFYNLDYQIFCNPVSWTKWFLIGCWISFILVSIFKKIQFVKGLVLGLISVVAFYIILFGSTEYLGFIFINSVIFIPLFFVAYYLNKKTKSRKFDFLNFYGVVVLLPYIILFFAFSQIKNTTKTFKLSFIIPSILILLFSVFTAYKLTKINSKITKANYDFVAVEEFKNNFTDRYLLELSLGVHWKYHTKICLYDGWRPPFHDPVVIISRNISAIFSENYEISLDLKKR